MDALQYDTYLKDAYYFLPIDKKFRKYLRFSYNNHLYEFNCLPFGLNIAPFIFTKLLRPVAKYLRRQGCKIIIYLDDILIIGKDFNECQHSIYLTKKLLLSLGFIINIEKSLLIPNQRLEYLGFIFNSRSMTLSLPGEKCKQLTKLFIKFKKIHSCKIRQFASLVGKLVSISPTLRYSWVHVKPFEIVKQKALKQNNFNFTKSMIIPKTLHQELDWWINNISRTINPLKQEPFCLEIFSDASNTGWGACCENQEAQGFWNKKEGSSHINELELCAAFYGLRCFATHKSNCNILLRIDNITAIACINRMGSIRHSNLNWLSKQIWTWCEARNIFIFASYINTADNFKADLLLRNKYTCTEFELHNNAFLKNNRKLWCSASRSVCFEN